MQNPNHPLLKHTRAWLGGDTINLPKQNLTDQALQIYQGIANTAGPYANLSGQLTPLYGQQGLSNLQQQLFGYDSSGGAGSIGTPSTPAGGFLGAPQSFNPYYGAPAYGPTPAAGPGDAISAGAPATAAFNPFSSGATGAPATAGAGGQVYSPPNGTLIGLGKDNAFNDPYAGSAQPSQSAGYHPGVLDLNTTALNTYGGPATQALLNSNPYLSDALNLQNIAAFNAAGMNTGPSDLLNSLNSRALTPDSLLSSLGQRAQSGLDSNGALSAQEQRDLTQGALTSLGQGGLSHGNTGIAVDLLSRDSAVRQRQQQAQQFAGLVEGLNQTQNQFGLGVQSANQAQNQFGLSQQGLAGQLAQAAAGTASSSVTNPILQILGLGNLNTNANPGTGIADQNALFNPFQQLGNQISNNNLNAAANSQIANANSQAATNSGILNLIGSFAGGYAGGG